tara:strand:- start:3274 stop:3531 length:258 start_codon:yes stop_codon:yes gene_type:complete
VWFGWHGGARWGTEGHVLVWQGRHGKVGMDRHGQVGFGRRGAEGRGRSLFGVAGQVGQGTERHGRVWHGGVWQSGNVGALWREAW